MNVKNREDRYKTYFGGETHQTADGSDVWGKEKESLGGNPRFCSEQLGGWWGHFLRWEDREGHAGEARKARAGRGQILTAVNASGGV